MTNHLLQVWQTGRVGIILSRFAASISGKQLGLEVTHKTLDGLVMPIVGSIHECSLTILGLGVQVGLEFPNVKAEENASLLVTEKGYEKQ